MTPLVTVFVPTHRRPELLRRALESLRAQTCARWIALVQNDSPGDAAPREIVAALRDARIRIEDSPVNRGGTATLDLAFARHDAEFGALLEDDNWWEPSFLATMVGALSAHPDVPVAWANQFIAEEQVDGTWRQTGRTVRPLEPGSPPRRIAWGDRTALTGAWHANGTLFWRTRDARHYQLGIDLPMAATEPARERLFPHPLLYVPEPLGHFAVTRQTARRGDRPAWAAAQVLLIATFARHCRWTDAQRREVWHEARRASPTWRSTLLLAALQAPSGLLRHANAGDVLRLARDAALHPGVTWCALRARRRHPHWWARLNDATAKRFADPACLIAPA